MNYVGVYSSLSGYAAVSSYWDRSPQLSDFQDRLAAQQERMQQVSADAYTSALVQQEISALSAAISSWNNTLSVAQVEKEWSSDVYGYDPSFLYQLATTKKRMLDDTILSDGIAKLSSIVWGFKLSSVHINKVDWEQGKLLSDVTADVMVPQSAFMSANVSGLGMSAGWEPAQHDVSALFADVNPFLYRDLANRSYRETDILDVAKAVTKLNEPVFRVVSEMSVKTVDTQRDILSVDWANGTVVTAQVSSANMVESTQVSTSLQFMSLQDSQRIWLGKRNYDVLSAMEKEGQDLFIQTDPSLFYGMGSGPAGARKCPDWLVPDTALPLNDVMSYFKMGITWLPSLYSDDVTRWAAAQLYRAAQIYPNRVVQGMDVYRIQYAVNDCAALGQLIMIPTPFLDNIAYRERVKYPGQDWSTSREGSLPEHTTDSNIIMPSTAFGGYLYARTRLNQWWSLENRTIVQYDTETAGHLKAGQASQHLDQRAIWGREIESVASGVSKPYYFLVFFNISGTLLQWTDTTTYKQMCKLPANGIHVDVYLAHVTADTYTAGGITYAYKGQWYGMAAEQARQVVIDRLQDTGTPYNLLDYPDTDAANNHETVTWQLTQCFDPQLLVYYPKWTGDYVLKPMAVPGFQNKTVS